MTFSDEEIVQALVATANALLEVVEDLKALDERIKVLEEHTNLLGDVDG